MEFALIPTGFHNVEFALHATLKLLTKSLLKVSTQSRANVGAPRVSYLLTQTFEFPFAAAYFRVAKFRTLKNSLPPFYTSPRLLVPLQ